MGRRGYAASSRFKYDAILNTDKTKFPKKQIELRSRATTTTAFGPAMRPSASMPKELQPILIIIPRTLTALVIGHEEASV